MVSCSNRSNIQNTDKLHDTELDSIESVSDSLSSEKDANNVSVSQGQADGTISEDIDEMGELEFARSQHSVDEHGNICNFGLVAYYGDWIYFINSADSNLYRIKKDGTDLTKMGEGMSASCLCVSEDSIYIYEKAIYKMDLDGSEKNLIYNNSIDCFEVEGDWIYYCNTDDKGIYKMKTDGSDNTFLYSDRTYRINVANGWIYYISHQDGMLYRLRTDGSLREIVCAETIYQFIVSGDWIYYTCPLQGLYKVKIDGQDKTLFIDEFIEYAFNMDNDWVYYGDLDGLNKISINGYERTKLSSDKSVIAIGLAHDKIVYYYHLAGDCGQFERVNMIDKSGTSDMCLYSEGELLYMKEQNQ